MLKQMCLDKHLVFVCVYELSNSIYLDQPKTTECEGDDCRRERVNITLKQTGIGSGKEEMAGQEERKGRGGGGRLKNTFT